MGSGAAPPASAAPFSSGSGGGSPARSWSRLAVALLVSGIFGNLTDSLFREHATGKLFNGTFFDGYVVDFLRFDFGFPPFYHWPSFNVADSCVVCAAILLALSTFLEKPEEQKI